MIPRAFIHVEGPDGCGKTTFVEALLAAADAPMIVGRCTRDDSLRRIRESSPRGDPELRRYLRAGAGAATVFAFPRQDANPVNFYDSRLMLEYSEAVILEGDNPAVRSNPHLADDVRSTMMDGIAQLRAAAPPRLVDYWAVSERFQGIERAGLVVVNLRDPAERPAAEQLLVDLARLRKDDPLFNDIVGLRGNRVPITAVVSNLADPRDGGRKKAVARVRRTIRTAVPLRNR